MSPRSCNPLGPLDLAKEKYGDDDDDDKEARGEGGLGIGRARGVFGGAKLNIPQRYNTTTLPSAGFLEQHVR